MKKSDKIAKEIDKLFKEREQCDKHDFDMRLHIGDKIQKLSSEYELQLNKEAGIE